MTDEEKTYQYEDFEPFLEQEFTLSKEGIDQTISITLIEVERAKYAPQEGMRHGFHLLFQLPPEMPLEQGHFTITNEKFGTIGLFLVSVQPNEKGSLMESVFN